MSKSLGNLVFVDQLRKEWDPRAIRLAIIEHHYRDVVGVGRRPACPGPPPASSAGWRRRPAASGQRARRGAGRARRRPRRAACPRRHRRRRRPRRGRRRGGGAPRRRTRRSARRGVARREHRQQASSRTGSAKAARTRRSAPLEDRRPRAWTSCRPTGGAILCPNHISFLDSAFLMLTLPRRITFVGKAEYMDSWKTKYLFPAMGMIPIDRIGRRRPASAALDAAEGVLRRGELFGIFPEGTRSRDGVLHKGHTGPARLALDTGCPIYPGGHRRARPTSSRPTPSCPKPVHVVRHHHRATRSTRRATPTTPRTTSPAGSSSTR